ncbi:hypothetical protein BpHYR1_005654 [Brachionus plicatilis]|uniref:Uncharacterized protein n=1 Tax=Brachionus plicatilis TaxID=10195 RepID=A0A3M7Q030_BRAPC|nr:hypothetical protein BpHYR1_005654 [Brachionus plicatilis]
MMLKLNFSINNQQKIYDPNLFHCVPMQSQTYTDDSFRSGQCDVNPYENAVTDDFFSKLKMNETDSIITQKQHNILCIF